MSLRRSTTFSFSRTLTLRLARLALALTLTFPTFVFAALILALAALGGVLPRSLGATGIANDLARLARACDGASSFALAFTFAALVLAALPGPARNLIGDGR